MKFSIKALAAAAALVAATGAHAAIDIGAQGDGGLFFSAWDGKTSYSFDMKITMDAFQSQLAAPGQLHLSYGGSVFTPSFSDWLSTANVAKLQWNILAAETKGDKRILTTSSDAVLPAINKQNDVLRTSAQNLQQAVIDINDKMVRQGHSDYAITVSTTDKSYGGWLWSFYDKTNVHTTGTLAANTYETGLAFQRTDAKATGIAKGTNTAYMDDTFAVRAWVDANNTLHLGSVSAVPEPSEYALMLGGLGLLAAVARRRNKRG